ncbi:hypothetical protein L1D34_11045 [Vibrio mediterranei]|uniref:hypothetical protein n=1 Tax=Vibrio mediterranei TaxID=689 RepID=UPI001EFCBE3F|nr:hypothetical protein [Vibrio mediterranei]MCG9625380.1 hypothetical protein [Vibrio mediterranei]
MTRLFMICTDVIYSDEWLDWSLNETVIIDVFESENRKEARKRTARVIKGPPLLRRTVAPTFKVMFSISFKFPKRLYYKLIPAKTGRKVRGNGQGECQLENV